MATLARDSERPCVAALVASRCESLARDWIDAEAGSEAERAEAVCLLRKIALHACRARGRAGRLPRALIEGMSVTVAATVGVTLISADDVSERWGELHRDEPPSGRYRDAQTVLSSTGSWLLQAVSDSLTEPELQQMREEMPEISSRVVDRWPGQVRRRTSRGVRRRSHPG